MGHESHSSTDTAAWHCHVFSIHKHPQAMSPFGSIDSNLQMIIKYYLTPQQLHLERNPQAPL